MNDLWYLGFLDKSGFPKDIYDGSKESINIVFRKYIKSNVIEWSFLEKDDSI